MYCSGKWELFLLLHYSKLGNRMVGQALYQRLADIPAVAARLRTPQFESITNAMPVIKISGG